MKLTLKDSLHAKIRRVTPAYNFLQSILQDANVYLFGGGVRDYLDGMLDSSRDLDFVIESKSGRLDIGRYLENSGCTSYTKNRFGGYKIIFSDDLVFDVWNLEDTWAFKTRRLPTSAESLMDSVYLNIDGLVYSIASDTYLRHCDELYAAMRKKRRIDVVYDETPFEDLNLLRALVLKKKYDMLLSSRLKSKLYERYRQNQAEAVKRMLDLEVSHYGSSMLSKTELIYELESAKQEAR